MGAQAAIRLAFTGKRAGRAFTSVTSGNWNDPATWGEAAQFPVYSDDTCTISAGHNVILPAGNGIGVGAISFAAGTTGSRATVTVNGTLVLFGNASMGAAAKLAGGAGGALYLNGNTITANGDQCLTEFIGNVLSRFTISGGAPWSASPLLSGRGTITKPVDTNRFTPTWRFCAVMSMADAVIGRSQTSAMVPEVSDCTFTDMQQLVLDQTSTNANAGFIWNRNDVRTMSSLMTANFAFPGVTMANQAIGTGAREIKDNTYDVGALPSGPVRLQMTNVKATDIVFTGNVLGRVRMHATGTQDGWNSASNFWYDFVNANSDNDGTFQTINTNLKSVSGDYFYYEGNQHCFADNSNPSAWSFQNFVFENGGEPDATIGYGTNWFINLSDAGTISNGVCLGTKFGNLAVNTNAKSYTTGVVIKNITAYIDNKDMGDGNDLFPAIMSFEQVGADTNHKLSVYNCLHYDIDEGATTQEFLIGNTSSSGAQQLDRVSHNGGWPLAPQYGADLSASAATMGTSDVNVDPAFADKDRNLADWDASLGGAGTAGNAISELLKKNGHGGTYNSSYSVAALIAYVFAGFQPTGAGATAYNGTGFGGANIGAR